ncbi:MAG: hypothetical protein ACE5OZ_22660 [Candidatus Heimdallarchaeota archaeon]
MTDIQENSLADTEKAEIKKQRTANDEIAKNICHNLCRGIGHNLLLTAVDFLPVTLIGLVDDPSLPEMLNDLPLGEDSLPADSGEFTVSTVEFQDGSGTKPKKRAITQMEA